MQNIRISSYTDIGDIKTTNQDCILSRSETINNHKVGLFIVADGCGGLAYGEEISNLVVTHFSRVWNKELKDLLSHKAVKRDEVEELLEKAVKEINNTAKNFGGQVGSKVGSTLSLLLTIDKHYYIKNVGDSRVYLVRKNKIMQLTEDQSLVADMIRNGEMTKEAAKNFKKKNILTMCIGVFEDIKTYSKTGRIKDRDIFLLCCDGLHNKVSENDMVKIIRNKEIEFEDKAKALRDAINGGDANDNVSGVLCEFERKKQDIKFIICIIILLLCAAIHTYHIYTHINAWRRTENLHESQTEEIVCNMCGKVFKSDSGEN